MSTDVLTSRECGNACADGPTDQVVNCFTGESVCTNCSHSEVLDLADLTALLVDA